MTNLFENKAAKYVLIACSLLIIAIVACVVTFKIIEKRNVDYTYAIARGLGYTDAERLLFIRRVGMQIAAVECFSFSLPINRLMNLRRK